MPIHDYKTFGQLLSAYSPHCQIGDLTIHDGKIGKSPHDWLISLSGKELKGVIEGIESGGGKPDRIDVRTSGFFGSKLTHYTFHWLSDREGWAYTWGKVIHYFIPRNMRSDDHVLDSLCGRVFMYNNEPFFPNPHSKCKTCEKHLEKR